MVRSMGSCLGEAGVSRVGSAVSISTGATEVFCSKPREAMSSTKEGRGVDMLKEGGGERRKDSGGWKQGTSVSGSSCRVYIGP